MPLSGCSARNVYSRCLHETQSRGGDFRRHCEGISACAYRMFTVDVGAECLRPRTRHVAFGTGNAVRRVKRSLPCLAVTPETADFSSSSESVTVNSHGLQRAHRQTETDVRNFD